MKGFMLGVMSYNFKFFKEFAKDSHVLLTVIKHRISEKMKEKFEVISIKKNGREISLKIDKEKEFERMAQVNLMTKKNFNELFSEF